MPLLLLTRAQQTVLRCPSLRRHPRNGWPSQGGQILQRRQDSATAQAAAAAAGAAVAVAGAAVVRCPFGQRLWAAHRLNLWLNWRSDQTLDRTLVLTQSQTQLPVVLTQRLTAAATVCSHGAGWGGAVCRVTCAPPVSRSRSLRSHSRPPPPTAQPQPAARAPPPAASGTGWSAGMPVHRRCCDLPHPAPTWTKNTFEEQRAESVRRLMTVCRQRLRDAGDPAGDGGLLREGPPRE